MTRFLLITMFLAVAGLAVAANPPGDDTPIESVSGLTEVKELPTLARITSLVAQLSDDDYKVREPASNSLVRIGIAARPVLTEALESADVEIRHRASRILSIIMEDDFEARIRAFVADVDGEQNASLPGWERFAERTSGETAARAMFAQMYRSESELLAIYRPSSDDMGEISDAFNKRFLAIDTLMETDPVRSQSEISLGTIATLLLIASEPDVATGNKIDLRVTELIHWDAVVGGMRAKRSRSVMRRLMGDWIAKSTISGDDRVIQLNLQLAMEYDLPAGLAPAVQIVHQSTGNPAMGNLSTVETELQLNAIMVIGKLGSRENLADLGPLLEDKSVVRQTKAATIVGRAKPAGAAQRITNVDVQMRDVVLAVMVHMSGQKLSNYGFRSPETNEPYLFKASSLSFADAASRAAALAKWKRWSAGSQSGQGEAAGRETGEKATQG